MSELFVSTLNLMDATRAPIMAGTPFIKADMVEGTFKKLAGAGDIVSYIAGNSPAILSAPDGRSLGGPDNKTPAAAINPKKRGPEVLNAEEQKEKAEVNRQLAEAGIRVVHNSKLSTLKKKLADHIAANPPAEKPKGGAGGLPKKIWDMSPEDAATMPETQLYAKYKEICEEFDITPNANLTEPQVREKMCSQYNL